MSTYQRACIEDIPHPTDHLHMLVFAVDPPLPLADSWVGYRLLLLPLLHWVALYPFHVEIVHTFVFLFTSPTFSLELSCTLSSYILGYFSLLFLAVFLSVFCSLVSSMTFEQHFTCRSHLTDEERFLSLYFVPEKVSPRRYYFSRSSSFALFVVVLSGHQRRIPSCFISTK